MSFVCVMYLKNVVKTFRQSSRLFSSTSFVSSKSIKNTKVQDLDHLVFVYCTFKKGCAHDFMMDNATSSVNARSVDKYPMVISKGLPYLLDFKGHGHQVYGTLYRIPTKTLNVVESELLSISPSYTRSVLPIEVTEPGQAATQTTAIAWVRQQFPPELLGYEWKEEFVSPSPQRVTVTTTSSSSSSMPWFMGYSQDFQFVKPALN